MSRRFPIHSLCDGRHCAACRDEAGGAAMRAGWIAAMPEAAELLGSPCKPRGLAFGPLPATLPVVALSMPGSTAAPPSPPTPVPREKWPVYILAIADFGEPPDRGVGDTIKRYLGEGGEAFKQLVALAHRNCGCTDRQLRLNAKYPYADAARGDGSKGV